MAIADYRLTVSRYVRPGTYIGFVRIPRPVVASGEPRLPSYVGKGNRLALVQDLGHKRSLLEGVSLTFPPAPPYIAALAHPALDDKEQAQVYKQNGEPIARTDWAFRESVPNSGIYDQVEISLVAFDGTASYEIDYQSTDRTVLDELRFDDLRKMIFVGDTEGQDKYREFVDYRIVTQILGNVSGGDPDALIPGTNNAYLDGAVTSITETPAGAGDGTVAFNAANDYTHPYSMRYTLTVTAFAPGLVTFDVDVQPLSGGNDQVLPVPANSSLTAPSTGPISSASVAYQLDTNYPFTDGLLLDLSETTGFDVGDVFTWDALGPGLIEICSAHDNSNQFSEVSDFTEGTSNTSSGTIAANDNTDYTGAHDRDYYFEVTAVAGTGPTRTATIVATGYNELPYTEFTFSLDEAVASSLTNVNMELGVSLDFNFGVGHAAADGVNVVAAADATDLTTALTLATEIRTDFNAHDLDGGPTWHAVAGGSHQITAAVPTDLPTLLTFVADMQAQYTAHINDAAMHTPIDDVFTLDATTATDLATAVSALNDFKAKYNRHIAAVNFVVSDSFTASALAARQDFTAKDERTVNFTTTSVVAGTSIALSYYSDTIEGGFGNVTATPSDPYIALQDNICLAVRNFEGPSGGERHAANDTWNFSTANLNQIDWTLRQRATETRTSDQIFQDVLGTITGIPLAYYVILSETPDTVIRVREVATGNPVSYTLVQSGGQNTPYLSFLTDPGVDIEIYYEHKGEEPDPGQFYFITAHRLRADSEYNVPILYQTREDMQRGLAPRAPDNHLWIMGELAFDTGFFGAFFTQVKDAAGNGVFTLPDYRLAIEATETTSRITDLIVLSFFDALGVAKSSIEKMNDPFEAKERFLWVGAPIGTPIGDVDTPDTLVYLARKTLQFSGNNPGRGNVILVANTEATRSLILDDGSETTVTLDGSFIAGYAAARNASFGDPGETLLKKDTSSFDTMLTYNEQEEAVLGGASITFLSDVGSGLFRFGESITVDTSSPDLNEISAMNQRHFVVRTVRSQMNEALLGIVPPSAAAGVITVQGFLAETLQNIVSSGVIAPYGNEENPPTTRPISPSRDTYVFVDETDRRLYHFGFFFNIRFPIKRLFGLFSVDSRFWDNRSLSA